MITKSKYIPTFHFMWMWFNHLFSHLMIERVYWILSPIMDQQMALHHPATEVVAADGLAELVSVSRWSLIQQYLLQYISAAVCLLHPVVMAVMLIREQVPLLHAARMMVIGMQRIINWLYHDIDSAYTADVHLLSWALWPSTLWLIICVIHQPTLQRLCDHWKLTCSLLTSTLSALEVLQRNVLDKSTYLLTYWLTRRQQTNWSCDSGIYKILTHHSWPRSSTSRLISCNWWVTAALCQMPTMWMP